MKATVHILIAALPLLMLAACHDDEYVMPTAAEPAVGEETGSNGFQWVHSKDLSTRNSFVKSFGVGYSYDAVRGGFCNWEDLRCQVISRSELQKYERDNDVEYCHSIIAEAVRISSRFDFSLRDYVANITLSTDQEIDLGLYSNGKHSRQYVIENGVQQNIYYTHNETSTKARQYIEDANITTLVEYGEFQLLTNSFVNAVFHIAEAPKNNFAVVDSFIKVYGTHVVTSASLGGKLSVEIKNEMWRYNDDVSEEEWSEESFLRILSNKEELRQNSSTFKLIENAKINISAVGGDQSALSTILGEKKYDGTRLIDLDAVNEWRQSLIYNPVNEFASTVELIDMGVTPIWNFIYPLDEETGDRVKAAILQDASYQQKTLGDNNFFSTSFDVAGGNLCFKYRYQTDTWKNSSAASPSIKNIVSNGRYVATVCYGEQIDGHTLTVAYPIYEGKVNLACGLGVADDGTAYTVRWINGNVQATQLPATKVPQTSVFYANAGGLSLVRCDYVPYEPSFALPYVEVYGGVQPDGGYSSDIYNVYKDGDQFYIDAPQDATKLINWDYDSNRGCWKRNSQYTYIYNPQELDYCQ